MELPPVTRLISGHHLTKYRSYPSTDFSRGRREPTNITGRNTFTLCPRFGQIPLTQLLLEEGADVHATYQSTWTPLHLAAKGGHVDVAGLLFDYGAHVNDMEGKSTPLQIAVQ